MYLLHLIHHIVFYNEISNSLTLRLFCVASFISSPHLNFVLSRRNRMKLTESILFRFLLFSFLEENVKSFISLFYEYISR